ncbi:MAG: hypothetical protein ACI884_000245, partial [Ulvibacter sp.]
ATLPVTCDMNNYLFFSTIRVTKAPRFSTVQR